MKRDKLFRKESRGYTRRLLSCPCLTSGNIEHTDGFLLRCLLMDPRGNNHSDSLDKKPECFKQTASNSLRSSQIAEHTHNSISTTKDPGIPMPHPVLVSGKRQCRLMKRNPEDLAQVNHYLHFLSQCKPTLMHSRSTFLTQTRGM